MLLQLRINAILVASAFANWLFFNRRPVDPSSVRKVLIFQTRDLGDVVLATVLIDPLRRRFPNARIVMVTGEWARDLVEASVPVDGVATYHSDLAGNARGRRVGLPAQLGAIRRVARERPDVVIDLRGDFGTIAAAVLSGAAQRADRGTWRLRGAARRLFRSRTATVPADVHEAEESLQIAGLIGVVSERGRLHLSASADDVQVVDELLESGQAPWQPLVALHPGASQARKTWPAERFAALARLVAQRYGVRLVITGSASERHLSDLIAMSVENPVIDLCGRLTLSQLYALYRRCALWIGNDTGPMHFAAAASVPVVALWGPTLPGKYRPYGVRSLIVTKPNDGRLSDEAVTDDYMTGISVDHAWSELQGFLDDELAWLEPAGAPMAPRVPGAAG